MYPSVYRDYLEWKNEQLESGAARSRDVDANANANANANATRKRANVRSRHGRVPTVGPAQGTLISTPPRASGHATCATSAPTRVSMCTSRTAGCAGLGCNVGGSGSGTSHGTRLHGIPTCRAGCLLGPFFSSCEFGPANSSFAPGWHACCGLLAHIARYYPRAAQTQQILANKEPIPTWQRALHSATQPSLLSGAGAGASLLPY